MNADRTVVSLLAIIAVLLALNLVVVTSTAAQAEAVPRRCCFPDTGQCEILEPTVCVVAGGTPGGPGTDCTLECGPGACCIDDDCMATFDEEDCINQGGVYQGFLADCIAHNILCGDGPFGACCLLDGTCFVQSEPVCNANQGDWRGDGTDCFDFNGNDVPDDCECGDCRSDINEDGIVGINDFLTLLEDWGPCE